MSPKKTIVSPKATTILGWIWSQVSLEASPHSVATLSSCKPPGTVCGLRSYIGAYKFLNRVINGCSSYCPIKQCYCCKQPHDMIVWDESLSSSFSHAQNSLEHNKAIILPRSDDQLWIITDGSVKQHGIVSTLDVLRKGKSHLAGFFSAKLRKHQVNWLPCEIEALGIATTIKYFSPYIIQSSQLACVLTDSKPCVHAVEKLCLGEFSSSPRFTSFLSIVSRYQVSVCHLAGSVNIPSDFASRNAPDCLAAQCQICSLISRSEDSVVRKTSVQDIIKGIANVPFANRNAWISTQSACPDL